MAIAANNYQTSLYLIYQAKGQLRVLFNTESLPDFEKEKNLSPQEKANIALVEKIKRYSVDSLGYKPTKNFTAVFNEKNTNTLWVITACHAYNLKPYEWEFPIVGEVSYKGFFKKELAQKEYNHLVAIGYDADMRSVSAWSTLGWFNDPLLSSMLQRGKGALCNLLFHELFHATYYAPNSVDLNENLASFVAHKATLKFLKKDTAELRHYLQNYSDNKVFYNYMLRQTEGLKKQYAGFAQNPQRHELKLKAIYYIADSISYLPLHNKARFEARKAEILKHKNAYLVDFQQYDSKQDSLENAFNKFYRGELKKMVHDLTQR